MAAVVSGFLPTNVLVISTRPPVSSLLRWLDRLPFESPSALCRKRNSALRTEESTVRTPSRAGSWTRRSTSRSGRGPVAASVTRHGLHGRDEADVVGEADDRHGDPEGQH